MFTFRKRYLVAAFALLLLAVAAAPIIVLYFYQDKIRDYIIAELNKRFNGRTELAGFRVAPFANFPYISVDLQGLQFFGSAADTVPIYRFQDLYVGFDVAYLMRGKLNIKQLRAEEGELNIIIAQDGSINLLEAKKPQQEQTADSTDNTLNLDLKKIRLSDIRLKVDDRESGKFTNLNIADATSSFRYAEQVVDFRVDAIAELTEYTNGKTTLFRNKYFELHNDLSYDMERNFLDIRPGRLALKSGELNFGGTIDFANDMTLNLNFDGQKDNFDLFISLAPEPVLDAMEQFSTRGEIYLKGSITGKSLHTAPHIEVELGCANTFFARKDTKRDVVRDLTFKGFFNTGAENTLKTSVFYLESLYGAPENSYIKGAFRVENFENPLINMDFQADIDLRDLPDFMPTGSILQHSSGKVRMNIRLREYVTPDNVMEVASQLQDGTASRLSFENVSFKFKDYPNPIDSINGIISLEGDHLKTKQLSAKIGDSDLAFSLDLENLLHFFHGDDVPVAFKLKADARKLVPGQLIPSHMRPALDSVFAAVWRDEIYDFHAELDINTTSRTLDTFRYLPTLAVDFHDFRFRSKLYPNDIKEIRGVFDINDQHIRLKNFIFHAGESRMYATAEIAPVAPLRVPSRKEWVNFKADIQSPYFDVKKLVTYDGKCLLNEQIEREEIHKLDFKGSGKFWANVFKETGFVSELNIDRLLFRINDLPKVERVAGKIITDTLGSIQIKNFTASVGKTDIRTTLNLLHFLDKDLKNKQIKGSFEANMLDMDELTGYKESAKRNSSAKAATEATPAKNKYEDSLNVFAFAFPTMSLDLKIGKFLYHKYLIKNIKGRIRTTPKGYAYLDSMRFEAADGQMMVHGYFNGSNPKDVYLTGDLRMERINLNKLMYKFDNFGQEYLVSENLRGIMSGTVNTTARMHPDFTVDISKTTARAELTVQNGRLLRFAPLRAMATFMGERNLEDIAFGELTNTLEIKDGHVHIPAMKLTSTIGYMYLSGKQNFDDQLQMDYEIRLPLSLVKEASWNFLKSRLFGRGRRAAAAANPEATTAVAEDIPSDEELVEEEREIIDSQRGLIRRYINVRVAGTTSDFKISLGRRKR